MKRRAFIRLGMTGLAAAILQACEKSTTVVMTTNNGMGNVGGNMRPTSPEGYITGEDLYVPPLYEGTVNSDGVREFSLTAARQSKLFYSGQNTDTWSFSPPNQTVPYLGPTLKLTDGEQVRITYTNNLLDEITVHGHGMHVPGSEDGGPQRLIAPNGGTWTAQYTVQQPACTAWYHPHPMNKTAEQVYKGLAGMIIVEENSQNLGLPNIYGEDDIPLVLQDRVFNEQYQLDYSLSNMQIVSGWVGDVYLANGQAQPVKEVPQGWIRLRLLNGSNASVYKLTLSNGADFQVIAADNGFLPAPTPIKELIMSPGERLEVLVDMTQAAPGDTVQLKTDLVMPAEGMDPAFMNMDHSGVFLTLKAGAQTGIQALPESLASFTMPAESDAVTSRAFTLAMAGMMGGNDPQFTINGKSMDINWIDIDDVQQGQWELWTITNQMGMHHNFHVHGGFFVPLDRNGSADNLKVWEKNVYKDTIYVPGNATVRVLVKITQSASRDYPYMYHCHFLEHEDAGMMGQFTTI